MDLFSEIEGLSGENLGSALLRYLIFNSHEVREAFVELLSKESPMGPLACTNLFACHTEFPTEHDELGRGRLDFLVLLDETAIGIESKFFAAFQHRQTEKYLPSLKQAADNLGKINGGEVTPLFYVLCPASRQAEVNAMLAQQSGAAVVTWEEVIAALEHVLADMSNPVTQMVAREFIQYLKRQFDFIHDYARKVEHMKRRFPEGGSALQRELLYSLWSLFPSPGKRLSNGKTWLGYYFCTDKRIGHDAWFGFVPASEIQGSSSNEAELVIAAGYKPELDESFQRIEFATDNFNSRYGWIVNFDETWNSKHVWQKKLKPFWQVMEGLGDD